MSNDESYPPNPTKSKETKPNSKFIWLRPFLQKISFKINIQLVLGVLALVGTTIAIKYARPSFWENWDGNASVKAYVSELNGECQIPKMRKYAEDAYESGLKTKSDNLQHDGLSARLEIAFQAGTYEEARKIVSLLEGMTEKRVGRKRLFDHYWNLARWSLIKPDYKGQKKYFKKLNEMKLNAEDLAKLNALTLILDFKSFAKKGILPDLDIIFTRENILTVGHHPTWYYSDDENKKWKSFIERKLSDQTQTKCNFFNRALQLNLADSNYITKSDGAFNSIFRDINPDEFTSEWNEQRYYLLKHYGLIKDGLTDDALLNLAKAFGGYPEIHHYALIRFTQYAALNDRPCHRESSDLLELQKKHGYLTDKSTLSSVWSCLSQNGQLFQAFELLDSKSPYDHEKYSNSDREYLRNARCSAMIDYDHTKIKNDAACTDLIGEKDGISILALNFFSRLEDEVQINRISNGLLYSSTSSDAEKIWGYVQRGRSLYRQEQYSRAEKDLQIAYELASSTGEHRWRHYLSRDLRNLYSADGDVKASLRWAKTLVNAARKSKNDGAFYYALQDFGIGALRVGKTDISYEAFSEAFEVAMENNWNTEILITQFALATSATKKNTVENRDARLSRTSYLREKDDLYSYYWDASRVFGYLKGDLTQGQMGLINEFFQKHFTDSLELDRYWIIQSQLINMAPFLTKEGKKNLERVLCVNEAAGEKIMCEYLRMYSNDYSLKGMLPLMASIPGLETEGKDLLNCLKEGGNSEIFCFYTFLTQVDNAGYGEFFKELKISIYETCVNTNGLPNQDIKFCSSISQDY